MADAEKNAVAEKNNAVATKEVLAEAAAILEPVGLQEEAELPAKIMEEFMRNSQKQWVLQQKRLQNLTKISAEVKRRRKRALEKLDGSHQELETLKQQAGQEQEKLQRNQSYLQLLCSLQNKLVISEGKAEDKDVKGRALTAKSKSP